MNAEDWYWIIGRPDPMEKVKWAKPFAVRKLDTEDFWFYVVDLRIDGAMLISPESIVDKFRSSNDAHVRAKELNEQVV